MTTTRSIDPQSLIGAWEGAWQWRAGEAQSGGQYYLTIERIQGDKVFGSVQVGGRWTREIAGALSEIARYRLLGLTALPTSGRESGTKPSRFGIFTAGSVRASRTSASPMIPFRYRR
jgi:hypothetical protein